MPTFTPPTVDEGIPNAGRLWRFYKITRGVSVLVQGSTVTQTQYPDQQYLDDFDYVYLGGHSYDISDAEAATLVAAGYGDYIT